VLTNECVLRDPAGAGTAKWSGRDVELDSEAVQEHLRAGKQVYQLGLEFDGRMSFVLGEDLIVRKLRFFDNVTYQSDQDITTPQQEMETRFTLMTRELARLLSHLETWFDLRRPVS
ncbi:MAG TPA: recombination-associated protein RdgC, partial [Oleiagrimonas sp.]|nr:recombination-associated protein RdgC [Oleiagrimonas sp.]